MKFYITGATGNIGNAIVKAFSGDRRNLYIGAREPKKLYGDPLFAGASILKFDFTEICNAQLPADIDVIFIVRPPEISQPRVFQELIEKLKKIRPFVIFLSIHDAEHKEYTPHRKIERIIIKSGLAYSFIRPSYFMDNLTSTLYSELKNKKRIFLPAGHCKFNWIDAKDIGELICKVAHEKHNFIGSKLEITGSDTLDFYGTVSLLNEVTDGNYIYTNPSIVWYILYSIKKGVPVKFIMVMLLLHWLPKFSKEPVKTQVFQRIMGKPPATLKEFLARNLQRFI